MSLPRSKQETLLLHNPRCSKSRATLALLEEQGVEFSVREYLKEPLSRAELDDLAGRLGRAPAEWVRSGEGVFKERGLSTQDDAETLLDAIAEEPILMERPIVVRGDAARVGRPPESVLELF